MKMKTAIDNGNVDVAHCYNYNISVNLKHPENSKWSTISTDNSTNDYNNLNTTQAVARNINFLKSYNQNKNQHNTELLCAPRIEAGKYTSKINSGLVCNRLYRLDTATETKFQNFRNKKESANLEGVTETFRTSCETFLETGNVSPQSSSHDGDRTFEYSDAEESSGHGALPVPRGIVNPNYPGFQHLAHTLQDYSSTIDNFYHSENDMTDDDIDLEIADATYDIEISSRDMNVEYYNINNNNNNNDTDTTFNRTENEEILHTTDTQYNIEKSQVQSDIPDLIKTITENNNDTIRYDYNCSAIDIENNFNTKDIIGDFNKEIEDEIKLILNYNINIQDDLEELKKDIQDNLSKPIENTINNISDVVNHVIKKLVETHSDINECESDSYSKIPEEKQSPSKENSVKENEINILKEMRQSRPTFLFIENNINRNITDAHLSDGKDEININEQDYDTDKMSDDVENTIKQLSTELRKIIPKLDELRDREIFFAGNKVDSKPMSMSVNIMDRNCNEIASCSKIFKPNIKKSPDEIVSRNMKEYYLYPSMKKIGFRSKSNLRISRERQSNLLGCSHHSPFSSVQRQEESDLESFDVYNIETALPKLDIDTIENHLKAAKDAERRKRNDREEIRKRLAMGVESEEYYSLGHTDRPGKKPSLQSRLQSGKNLQICFMNETASDNESQTSDAERNLSNSNRNLSKSSIFSKSNYSLNNHPYQTRPLSVSISKHDKISTVQSVAKLRPTSLSTKTKSRSSQSLSHPELKESDFYALQATLQTEARMALAQAKEMARIEMERSRRSRSVSPVTEMLRRSMEKANAPLAVDRRRLSRHLLTDMNIAQLQVIVNELHSQIEGLNEALVRLLLARDDLHMGQDSMLVDIEDLTRYLGVKEQSKKTKGSKSAVRRLTSYIK